MVSGPAPGMRSNHWFSSPLFYSRAQLSGRYMRFESGSCTTWTCGMKGSSQPSWITWKHRCWSSSVLPPRHRTKSQLHTALMTQSCPGASVRQSTVSPIAPKVAACFSLMTSALKPVILSLRFCMGNIHMRDVNLGQEHGAFEPYPSTLVIVSGFLNDVV